MKIDEGGDGVDFEKMYTVNDVAKMTGLSTRTIRNYIKEGRLNGRKIGVQWRFTKEDIDELFMEQDVMESIEEAKNQLIIDYINTNEVENTTSCSIIDYLCCDRKEIENLCTLVLDNVNEYKKTNTIRFSYQYFEEYKKARFIIIGEVQIVKEILDIIEPRKTNFEVRD